MNYLDLLRLRWDNQLKCPSFSAHRSPPQVRTLSIAPDFSTYLAQLASRWARTGRSCLQLFTSTRGY